MYGSNVTCNVVKKCCLFLIMLCRMKEMLLPNSSKKKSDFGWNLPKTHLVAYFPNRSQARLLTPKFLRVSCTSSSVSPVEWDDAGVKGWLILPNINCPHNKKLISYILKRLSLTLVYFIANLTYASVQEVLTFFKTNPNQIHNLRWYSKC